MTNKRLILVILPLLLIGLFGSISIIYKHLNYSPEKQEYSVNQLNQKLQSAENQIRLIVNENNLLRQEIEGLKGKIDNLSEKLKEYGPYEQEAERNPLNNA